MNFSSQQIEAMKKTGYIYFEQGKAFADYKPKFPQIFEVVQSNAQYEKGTSWLGVGVLVEVPEGADPPQETIAEGWTTMGKNRTFKKELTFTKENIDDNQKVENMLKTAAKKWGQKWPETQDDLAVKVFNHGSLAAGHKSFNNTVPGESDSSGNLIYDGYPLFNLGTNLRSSKGGGTYYNHIGALGLSGPNLITALNLGEDTNAYDDKDGIVEIEFDTLLVPKSLRFTARVILESTLIPDSGNNNRNVLEAIVDLITWRKLSDADGWFVGKKKKGLIFQERMDADIEFYQSKKSRNWAANIMARAGTRQDNWNFWVASNTSTT